MPPMRIPILLAALLATLLVSCGSEPKQPEPPKAAAPPPKPLDESFRFPKQNLVGTEVVDKELLGKPFMPGGTLARYKKGNTEYEMFVCQLPTATDAALVLPDWRKAMTDAKLIPSFGGYFGQDAGRPVFVFPKGSWIAGVVGLPEKAAYTQARALAAALY
jgi:hypothetical protein